MHFDVQLVAGGGRRRVLQGSNHWQAYIQTQYMLTVHVPKSLQSHGLLEVPMQRLASRPLLALQEQDSAVIGGARKKTQCQLTLEQRQYTDRETHTPYLKALQLLTAQTYM